MLMLLQLFFSYIECGKVKQDQLKDVSKKKKKLSSKGINKQNNKKFKRRNRGHTLTLHNTTKALNKTKEKAKDA